jgi:hypothetical protein
MADFESPIAEIGGLEAVIRKNQAKIGAETKTIQDGREAIKPRWVPRLPDRCQSRRDERGNEIWPSGNESHSKRHLTKDEVLARRDEGLSGEDGGKSRRRIRKCLKKTPQ